MKFVPYNAVPNNNELYNTNVDKYFTTDYVLSFNNPTYAYGEVSQVTGIGGSLSVAIPYGGDGYNDTLPSFNVVDDEYSPHTNTAFLAVSSPFPGEPYAYRGSYVGRLLFADNDATIFEDSASLIDYEMDFNNGISYTVGYRYKFTDTESEYVAGSHNIDYYNTDGNTFFTFNVGSMLYLSLGEGLVQYKPDDVTEHEFWSAYDNYDIRYPYLPNSDEYNILFGACPRVFIDYVEITMMPIGIVGSGSGLDPREIGNFDAFPQNAFFGTGSSLNFSVSFGTSTEVNDGLEYYYTNATNSPTTPDEPDWVAFTLDWLSDAVSGILSVEFVPYITLGSIVAIILAFSVVMWWLKVYGGG